MTNDELAVKLGSVEGILQGMAERFIRMESAIDSIVSLDKAVAAQSYKHDAQQKEIRDLAHDIKNCQHQHILQSKTLQDRIEKLEADRNKMQGAVVALKLFSGFASLVIVTCGTWVYNRAEGNRDINIKQEYRIEDISREITDLKRQKPGRPD